MSLALLFIALAFAPPTPEKAVTETEKKEFLELLKTLPHRGEFFTDEGVKKAVPHIRVLLALNDKDVGEDGLYPVLALCSGLREHKEARDYATTHFAQIKHRYIKVAWGMILFEQKSAAPEVVTYLRQEFEKGGIENFGLGPHYEDFKEKLIQADEANKLKTVELVKSHTITTFPKFGRGQDYRDRDYLIDTDGSITAIRPHDTNQYGELCFYTKNNKGMSICQQIPQPKNFVAKHNFNHYFENAVLTQNNAGDLLGFWTIEGNGDHGFAIRKKGELEFQVTRIKDFLARCQILPSSDGSWIIIHGDRGFKIINRLDKDLKYSEIGKLRWSESWHQVDVKFISKNILHFFTSHNDRESPKMRTIDYDIVERKVLHNREALWMESKNAPERGTIVQSTDGSLHYFGGVNEVFRKPGTTRDDVEFREQLFYQAEGNAKAMKIDDARYHKTVVLGDQIIVCYSVEKSPDQIFFRVIRQGTLGPVSKITIAKDRKDNLESENMVLHAEGEKIWFVNTIEPNILHELKLVDVKKPVEAK